VNMFADATQRARAMGVYGFVTCASGSVGVFVGGLITSSLNWHWIFLVNVPFGIIVYVNAHYLIPMSDRDCIPAQDSGIKQTDRSPNLYSAALVTTSLILAVYAIIDGNSQGWTSSLILGALFAAGLTAAGFVLLERRARHPLVPLGLFRSRSLSIANIAAVLWAVALFSWTFTSALYMQKVLGHGAMQIALAFLPANVITAILALFFSAKIVDRFGIKAPCAAGLLLGALGLALFAIAPVDGSVLVDVLPGMTVFGIAAGISFNPILLAATSGVGSKNSGIAAGLIGTSSMMGGALGLAILTSASDTYTRRLSISGVDSLVALNAGYHLSFAIGALLSAAAAVLCIVSLPPEPRLPGTPLPCS
jgi:MFS family permease